MSRWGGGGGGSHDAFGRDLFGSCGGAKLVADVCGFLVVAVDLDGGFPARARAYLLTETPQLQSQAPTVTPARLNVAVPRERLSDSPLCWHYAKCSGGINIGMKSSYPLAEQVLEDLGDKVVQGLALMVAQTRDDLRVYRRTFPSWVADSTDRGLLNWSQ